jgi:hypothetical protein
MEVLSGKLIYKWWEIPLPSLCRLMEPTEPTKNALSCGRFVTVAVTTVKATAGSTTKGWSCGPDTMPNKVSERIVWGAILMTSWSQLFVCQKWLANLEGLQTAILDVACKATLGPISQHMWCTLSCSPAGGLGRPRLQRFRLKPPSPVTRPRVFLPAVELFWPSIHCW